jgi:hypothetical protein
MQTPLTFLAAFIVVLALIGLAAWLVRRFAGNNIGNNANRGRMPRLAVIDAAAVDGRRRLVLVRRDNVEHLLMIGGPTDVVVELNIVRAMPAREGAPQRPGEVPRAPALPDAPGWTDGDNRPDDLDAVETSAEPAGRRGQPSFADEVRRPVPQAERERRIPESAAALAPELPPSRPEIPSRQDTRVDPGMPRPPRPPRPEGAPRPRLAETLSRLPRGPEPTPPTPSPAQSTAAAEAEKELTDMAQRLEAALRRPPAPPVTAQASAAAEASASSSAPAVEPPRPPRASSLAPPVHAPEAPSAPAAPSGGRTGFENLEDEMASLLGRPKSPT